MQSSSHMNHFPVFLATKGERIVLAGGGDAALAKLRLLLKTEADVHVYAPEAANEIQDWHASGALVWIDRQIEVNDITGAILAYAADEDDDLDARTSELAQAAGVLVNIVDNLQASEFITPAMVDRSPVTIAIGTEGTAPVLARALKAELEERLSPQLGLLARVGKGFRKTAEALPFGRARRAFWSDYFMKYGPRVETKGTVAIQQTLDELMFAHLYADSPDGHVHFVGAGPGDPELLTLKARKALDVADVVIYDRLIAPEILELARREATMIEAGKTPYGQHTPQSDINSMIVTHAKTGAQVVRLKSGDATIFGRLEEELEACDTAGIQWTIVPGITSTSAAAASLGQSLTQRGRNSNLRFLTGHDIDGFADHDWRTLARPGEVTAIYMGKRAARFIQGRLVMHGADPETPISIVENASRRDEKIISTTLSKLPEDMKKTSSDAPALTIIGLAPRHTLAQIDEGSTLEQISALAAQVSSTNSQPQSST